MTKPFWQEANTAVTRREQRKQAFREKIIEAAIELFEAQGCDATTLDDICSRAEVSRPTFYSYYPSKQELIQALAEKLWLNLARELTELSLAQTTSAGDYLDAFIRMTRTELKKYNRLERELIRNTMALDPTQGNGMLMLQGLTALFQAVYEQGRKRGEVGNRFPVEFLAEMSMGAIATLMMRWAVDEAYPVDRRLTQLLDYLRSMIALNK